MWLYSKCWNVARFWIWGFVLFFSLWLCFVKDSHMVYLDANASQCNYTQNSEGLDFQDQMCTHPKKMQMTKKKSQTKKHTTCFRSCFDECTVINYNQPCSHWLGGSVVAGNSGKFGVLVAFVVYGILHKNIANKHFGYRKKTLLIFLYPC